MLLRDARRGDEEAVRRIVADVLAEFGMSFDDCGTDSDLKDISASYLDRNGVFRVAVAADERIVGCAGLYPLEGGEAEIRKMYLLPAFRGQGLGRLLLEQLVAEARQRGYRRLVLETASVLTSAEALYRSFGFLEVARSHMSLRADRGYALDLAPG